MFKRHGKQVAKSDSPKKVTKKKKRVSAPVVDEDQNKTMAAEPTPIKTKNQKKSKSKHKEIIDYSKQNHSNTFGKVQKWLLESPIVAQPAAQASAAEVEHTSKVRTIMSKSQSTPERLAQRSPKKVQSVGNLNDKVKLQVVYKPPFKFSLKLSKNSAVKTKIIGPGGCVSRNKRKLRTTPDKSSTKENIASATAANVAAAIAKSSNRRTALLVRTVSDVDVSSSPAAAAAALNTTTQHHPSAQLDEPNYETLNSKKRTDAAPVYENVGTSTSKESTSDMLKKPSGTINSATFRINKSVSGSNLSKPHHLSHSNSINNSTKLNGSNSNSRGSMTNLSAQQLHQHQHSSTDLSCGANTQFGSSQNLIRSSTTNLTKNHNRNSFDIKRGTSGNAAFDLSRSSTTNLCKERRHGSHANLQKSRAGGSNGNLQFDEIPPSNRSRRNSTSLRNQSSSPESIIDVGTRTSNIPRVPSNSNLKMPSLRHGTSNNSSSNTNNIPRANLKSMSFNQHTRFNGTQQQQQHGKQQRSSIVHDHSGRPHTADCTDGRGSAGKQFEWPTQFMADKLAKDDPLPSDLEVMVSDVENLVNDV